MSGKLLRGSPRMFAEVALGSICLCLHPPPQIGIGETPIIDRLVAVSPALLLLLDFLVFIATHRSGFIMKPYSGVNCEAGVVIYHRVASRIQCMVSLPYAGFLIFLI